MLVAPRIDGAAIDVGRVPPTPSRAAALLDAPWWRVAVVTGAPGCGKTAAVAAWASRAPDPVVWHDLADGPREREAIWRAVARATSGIAAASPTVVEDFVAGLAGVAPLVIVFDRADEVDDPAFWVDLGRLIEHGGPRAIVIARSPTAVPAGRWRAAGCLLEVGPSDLDDGADQRPGRRTEPDATTLTRIFRGVDPALRRAVTRLAVTETFDSALAAALVGPEAGDAVMTLSHHGLLETVHHGRRRVPPALGRTLRDELRHDDPGELRRLEAVAATHLADTGDLAAAYRVMVASGDADPAPSLVLDPLVDLARRGDQRGLDHAVAALPSPASIDEPRLAAAVASACLRTGRLAIAEAWVARLGQLDTLGDETAVARRRLVGAHFHLLRGEPEHAERELAGLGAADPVWSTDDRRWMIGVAARLALARQRSAEARWMLAEADAATSSVDGDGLAAWCDLVDGDVLAATRRLAGPLADIEHRVERPDQALLDAMVTAAWACYLGGDVAEASRYSTLALADADRLPGDWNLVRAAGVAIAVLVHLGGPAPARSLLLETRLRRRTTSALLDADLDAADVAILRAQGRLDAAIGVVDRMADGPGSRLLRASLEVAATGAVVTVGQLDDCGSWPASHRIAADALSAVADPPRLAAAVEEACGRGLVMPMVGHGPAFDLALLRLPLRRLHPRLEQLLATPAASVAPLAHGPVEPLTPRERTVLALLPSHLTYEQIAERLSLSVNTVKSNLKSIYRKLSVASRSDAVDAARAAHLV